MGILNNVAIQWLIRRVPDWGGWIGTFVTILVGIYAAIGPAGQEVVNMAVSGNWQGITLGALVPLLVTIYAQVISYRATVKAQVVTDDKQQRTLTPSAAKEVEAVTKLSPAPRKRTLLDVLMGK